MSTDAVDFEGVLSRADNGIEPSRRECLALMGMREDDGRTGELVSWADGRIRSVGGNSCMIGM